RVHDGLIFDRGQSAQAGLPTAPAIGPLDRGIDRDPELFACPSPLAIEHVVLEQRGERLHRGDFPASTGLSHRSDEVMTVLGVHERPWPELGEFNRLMQHRAVGEYS